MCRHRQLCLCRQLIILKKILFLVEYIECSESFFGVRTAPLELDIFNPAFNVTPNRYITGIITEKGILRPPYSLSIPAHSFSKISLYTKKPAVESTPIEENIHGNSKISTKSQNGYEISG
jgi:hypothetical protein